MLPRALAALLLLSVAAAADPLALALDTLALPPAALSCSSQSACPGSVTRLARRLEGAGFHRRLHLAVEGEWAARAGEACSHCQLALLQELPAGAYVDGDELAAEARRGGAWPEGPFRERP